jgi:hypothetical protein
MASQSKIGALSNCVGSRCIYASTVRSVRQIAETDLVLNALQLVLALLW